MVRLVQSVFQLSVYRGTLSFRPRSSKVRPSSDASAPLSSPMSQLSPSPSPPPTQATAIRAATAEANSSRVFKPTLITAIPSPQIRRPRVEAFSHIARPRFVPPARDLGGGSHLSVPENRYAIGMRFRFPTRLTQSLQALTSYSLHEAERLPIIGWA